MIHQTIAKLGQGIHFRGQNIHWSILTGVLDNHYIRIYILEWNLLEKSVKRPFCCTVSILQVYFTYLAI